MWKAIDDGIFSFRAMTLVIEFDRFKIELEGRVDLPGSFGYYDGPPEDCYPTEAPTFDYHSACMIRNGRERILPVRNVIKALERRLGEDWEEKGVLYE